MQKLTILLMLLLLSLYIFPYTIINNGNGMDLYNGKYIITPSSIFQNELNKVEFDKVYSFVLSEDSIVVLADKYNVEIMVLGSLLYKVQTFSFDNEIKKMFFVNSLLFVKTSLQLYVYKYAGEIGFIPIKTSIRDIERVKYFNGRFFIQNNFAITLYTFSDNKLIKSDSILFDSLSDFGNDNFNNLCVIKAHYIYYYDVSDSGINYISSQYLPHNYNEFFNIDTLIYLLCDSMMYIYKNISEYSVELTDSFYIDESINTMHFSNDTLYILSNEKLIKRSNSIISESITRQYKWILFDNNDNAILVSDTAFLQLYNDSLYVVDNYSGEIKYNNNNIILNDSIIIFMNDTLNKVRINSLPICIERDREYIVYVDKNYNIIYKSLNTLNDSFICSLSLPAFGIDFNNSLIASGNYGINKYSNGDIIRTYIDGRFYNDVCVLFNNPIGISRNGIIILDTLLMPKKFYQLDINSYIKTDSMLFILTDNAIYSFSDTLNTLLNLPNDASTMQLAPLSSQWILLYDKNVIISLTKKTSYIWREKPLNKFVDFNQYLNYNKVFNILGSKLKVKNSGVYFIKNGENNYKKIINF